MSRFISWFALLPALLAAALSAQANGFGINATRLIYKEDAGSISTTVRNTESKTPYLVQSSVSNHQQSWAPAPFTVTPPLFRLEPQSINQLRISFKGGPLPRDRESIFYLHTKAIPSGAQGDNEQSANAIQGNVHFGVGKIIKLFYRPAGIKGTSEAAQGGLTFERVAGGLKVSNPSSYFVSLAMLEADNKQLPLDSPAALMLPPGGSHTWSVATARAIKWQTINDTGGNHEFSRTIP
ncbi:fimbrial biogenesis chaperone [Enterobacter dykesii]|uniref:fimbrial biogenesis chaperone n=1 Tax=Enterobacter dykesii TaxID=2797506 RepID=UPI0032B45E8C